MSSSSKHTWRRFIWFTSFNWRIYVWSAILS